MKSREDELVEEREALLEKHLQLRNQIGRVHAQRAELGNASGFSIRHHERLRSEARTIGHQIEKINVELSALRRASKGRYSMTLADWFVRVAERRLSAAEFHALREEAREELWQTRSGAGE